MGPTQPAYVALENSGRLAEVEAELWRRFSPCQLCPRRCNAKRAEGERGECGLAAELKVASFGQHYGEEKPLVGRKGSGTIFFAHCNLLCIFCQNWEIAHKGEGLTVEVEKLAEIMLRLQERGAHNINLVSPSHVLPAIVAALRLAIHDGLRLPLVYNTGGYDAVEVVALLEGVIDIYMPDCKFQDAAWAARLTHGADDYPEQARAAIVEMHRQVGDLVVRDGLATRGLLLRHLVMPHNAGGTDRFVRWVAETLGPNTYVNLMAQYRPVYRASEVAEIAHALPRKDFEQAVAWARESGLQRLDGVD